MRVMTLGGLGAVAPITNDPHGPYLAASSSGVYGLGAMDPALKKKLWSAGFIAFIGVAIYMVARPQKGHPRRLAGLRRRKRK